MLSILFGNCEKENYIDNPDMFFDNTYEEEWLEDDLSKEMVKDVDNSELVSPYLVISPVLGSISINRLSGGVKTLIQIAHDRTHIYNASACGDNCAPWMLKIGESQDVLVRLGHIMHFPEGDFRIRIENNGAIVHTQEELVKNVIMEGLLDE